MPYNKNAKKVNKTSKMQNEESLIDKTSQDAGPSTSHASKANTPEVKNLQSFTADENREIQDEMDSENASIKRKLETSSEEEGDYNHEEECTSDEEEFTSDDEDEIPKRGISRDQLAILLDELRRLKEVVKDLQQQLSIAKANSNINPSAIEQNNNNEDFPTLKSSFNNPKQKKTSKDKTIPAKKTSTSTSLKPAAASGPTPGNSDTLKNLPVIVLYNENPKKIRG
ncbi:putative uncharacterized protein DDB_G0289963 [Drosophila takahashii]|uniref:putative uncharacterized protein DDB_G0289963 n=1 Tax=Drosophila takahashii TaxID=29030 RepID=UPI0038994C53